MGKEIAKVNQVTEISTETWFSEKQIEVLKNTSLNTLKTQSQVILALNVAKKYDLDIFAKEFWAWVDNKGRLITIASAEWFKKIARKQKGFISIEANAVFDGEEFSLNTWTWKVSHSIKLDSRWSNKKPVWAYARLKMEWKVDEVKWVDWSEYSNDQVTFASPWKKQRSAMIEKCAITVLCRQAFWLSGLYGEEETDHTRNLKKDVSNEVDLEEVDKQTAKLEQDLMGGVVIDVDPTKEWAEKTVITKQEEFTFIEDVKAWVYVTYDDEKKTTLRLAKKWEPEVFTSEEDYTKGDIITLSHTIWKE